MIDILFIAGTCILMSIISVLCILFLRKRNVYTELAKDHDVTGNIYSIVGSIYSVLLAFTVVVDWGIYRDTESKVSVEVAAMASIFRDSRVFSDVQKATLIQRDLMTYATIVIEEEWPLLAKERSSRKAIDQIHRVFKDIADLHPADDYEKIWYQELIQKADDFSNARNQRVLSSTKSIPVLMWGVIIFGGLITISCSFLSGVSNTIPHLLMVGALSCLITLVIMLVYALDHPFTGIITVKSDPFVNQLFHWKEYYHASPL